MAKCSSCSAPLAANTNTCVYCNTRNDVDLKNKLPYTLVPKENASICPDCEKPLQTLNLHIDDSFLVERCISCYGLFLAQGQIETLLEKSVEPVYKINLQQLDNINHERFSIGRNGSYSKCPVCQSFMSRKVFGYRSGVIVDRCPSHGIWLDSGELTHLMEWKKSGGQLLQEQQKIPEKLRKDELRSVSNQTNNTATYSDIIFESDLLESVLSLIGKLFD